MYLYLLELLLFRNVHHNSVWDNLPNLRVLLGRIFVSSVVSVPSNLKT